MAAGYGNPAYGGPSAQNQANQDQERARQEELRRQRDEQERRAQERQRQRQQQQQQQQQVRKQEQEQKQQEQQNQVRKQEREQQKADAEAAKVAEQKAEKQAKEQYLKSVAAGSRLVATKCPDGKGTYYATGKRPNIKPEVIGCVDLRFRAYCPGSTQYSEGIAKNFIGMSGCFGDTYEIEPKPNCKADEVRIDVIEATHGYGGH